MHVNKLCMSLYFKLDTADMYNEDLNQTIFQLHTKRYRDNVLLHDNETWKLPSLHDHWMMMKHQS